MMLKNYHFIEYLTSSFEYQVYDEKNQLDSFFQRILPEKMDSFLSLMELGLHDELILILPRSAFIEKKLTLPSGTESEILQMTQMQILKILPFSENEIWAYPFKIEKKEDGFCFVLVYMLLKNTLQDILKPFIANRKLPHRIIPSHLRSLFYDEKPSENHFFSNIFVLCKSDAFEVSVCDSDGQFIFSRTIELSGTEDQSPCGEVMETLDYARKKYALASDFSSLFVSLTPLSAELNRELELMPHAVVKTVSPAESVKTMVKNLNFISCPMENVVLKNKKRIRLTYIFRVLFIFFIALIGIGGYMFMTESRLINELDSLKIQLRKSRTQAELALQLKKQIDLVTSHRNANIFTLKIISELYDIIPSYIHLTMLQIKSSSQIVIKGATKQGMMEIMGKIEKSPLFQNASLLYQNKLNNEEGMEFHISAEIEEGV